MSFRVLRSDSLLLPEFEAVSNRLDWKDTTPIPIRHVCRTRQVAAADI